MYILLFDIDGTLIHTGGAGGAALLQAFSELFGVPDPQTVPFSGRTDRGIAANLFQAHHIEDTEENFQRLRDRYLSKLPHHLPRHRGRVLPGIEAMLRQLAQRPDVHLGLLTGNVRCGAQAKLHHYGLWDYFSFGGFGDRHRDRDEVARDAFQEGAKRVGEQPDCDRLWVIGDTPLDIRCARAIGARSLAVATGVHTRDELQQASPDLLLDSFASYQPVLRVLLDSA
jgi:phosphoglycolate phosphatase